MKPKITASPEPKRPTVSRRLPKLIKVQTFGRYTLVAKLGRGGMAEVFLGYQAGPRGFRKPIVIKKILSDLAEDPRLVQMFFDEARLAARLHHPNVVQTIDVGEEDGRCFLAMEYLEGQPLSEVIRRSRRRHGAVPPGIAARIVSEALDGLHYAHELRDFDGSPMGVVHRDVSPQNIFITYGGVVKILDFGVAKAATQVVETRTGAVKGKYAYMAPEQGRGSDIDCRADVWAAGVIFWESLAGRRLFKEKTEYATLKAVMEQPIPELSAGAEALVFKPILASALSRQRENRFKNAQQMRDAIVTQLERGFPRVGRAEISRYMKSLFDDVHEDHERTLGVAMNADEERSRLTAPGKRSEGMTPASTLSDETPEGSGEQEPRTVPTAAPFEFEGAEIEPSIDGLSVGLSARKSRMRWGIGITACVVLGALIALWMPKGTGPITLQENTTPGLRLEPSVVAEERPNAEGEPEGEAVERLEVPLREQEPTVEPEGETEEATVAEPEQSETERSVIRRPTKNRVIARPVSTLVRMVTDTERVTMMVEAAMVEASRNRARMGTLRFQTHPWSDVYIGARLLGRTPGSFQIPAGSHILTLRNPEMGITERYGIRVEAGETTSRTISIGP